MTINRKGFLNGSAVCGEVKAQETVLIKWSELFLEVSPPYATLIFNDALVFKCNWTISYFFQSRS